MTSLWFIDVLAAIPSGEKFKQAFAICKEIASAICEYGTPEFRGHLGMLDSLLRRLRSGNGLAAGLQTAW